jgi:hypothetical protein
MIQGHTYPFDTVKPTALDLAYRNAPCRSHGLIDPNVEAVKEQLSKRSEAGLKKYGVTTERTDLDTKQWLQHLQEELMDACIYIETIKGRVK